MKKLFNSFFYLLVLTFLLFQNQSVYTQNKPSIINERECALANDEEESWSKDAENEWYDQLADA